MIFCSIRGRQRQQKTQLDPNPKNYRLVMNTNITEKPGHRSSFHGDFGLQLRGLSEM
jgi:hypothetical protein